MEDNWDSSTKPEGLDSSREPSLRLPWMINPQLSSSTELRIDGFPSFSTPVEGIIGEDRAASASKSHSQAEKRRRDRINAQLATLRKLIPKSDKMDKAALLGSAIDQVKDLKRKAMEASKNMTVPTDMDEVTIDSTMVEDHSRNNIEIKVSVSCDDRPELFTELIQVIKGLRLTTIRADMASVGGRIKSILVLGNKDGEKSVCLNTVQQSLKLVLSRLSSSSSASTYRIRSKRQRFFLPSHYSK
ncbi:transcription factor bHLH51-like [Cucurbita maxima]|uniref:Transcription factor bHLH51-like n=1 Tax=Cucurbita maxima TaxID=3661 RepID=A0A6J1K1E0_CUCMA|nr:transcription factor bHLH51-like [Cucurbita maxima]XP_022993157.1 transcription factor bHLH51-like [Cucurbita maxima]XP_022993158.1 transcription factor bHLH51-like [Cucurbita maxima]